jgi:hypothetical protein
MAILTVSTCSAGLVPLDTTTNNRQSSPCNEMDDTPVAGAGADA